LGKKKEGYERALNPNERPQERPRDREQRGRQPKSVRREKREQKNVSSDANVGTPKPVCEKSV